MSPCQSQRDHGDKQVQLGRAGDPGVLHVEAPRLGIGEQAFDLPALPVDGQGSFRLAIGGDDDHGAVFASFGNERHRSGVGRTHSREVSSVAGQLKARPLAPGQGGKRGFAAVIQNDVKVLLDPDRERDVVAQQELEPVIADELAVGKQSIDRARAEYGQVARHQVLAVSGAAAARRKHAPQDGDAYPTRGNRQHQKVDVLRTHLPAGPVQT